MIDHVNAFALVVKDVRKSAEFYRDKLGFILKDVSDNFAYLKFSEDKGPGLALVSKSGHEKDLANGVEKHDSNHAFYFASFLEDADKEFEELRSKGVKFIVSPVNRPDGQRYAFFEDPEGNLWEISHFS